MKALHHFFEHIEGLALVLNQRIMLCVAAQADALFQVIHREQVVFPLRVDHAQHDHALVIAHGFGANQHLLRVIALLELGKDGVAHFLAIHLLRLKALSVDIHPEAREDCVLQGFEVPVGFVLFRRTVPLQNIAENPGDVILDDEIFLVESFEQSTAQAIDRFALLVHDVVIFEQMFASFEVLPFDGFLRNFNATRDHARFNGNPFFHSKALQKV